MKAVHPAGQYGQRLFLGSSLPRAGPTSLRASEWLNLTVMTEDDEITYSKITSKGISLIT